MPGQREREGNLVTQAALAGRRAGLAECAAGFQLKRESTGEPRGRSSAQQGYGCPLRLSQSPDRREKGRGFRGKWGRNGRPAGVVASRGRAGEWMWGSS